MGKIATSLGFFCLLASSQAMAAEIACAPDRGSPRPWTINGAVRGDEYAWIYLELDKHGWVKHCLMGENSIEDPDRRFFICKYMIDEWRPIEKDGQRIASTTVERFFMVPGPDHKRKLKKAQERYFAEHPRERLECYPEERSGSSKLASP
jgi:hypothetical protein